MRRKSPSWLNSRFAARRRNQRAARRTRRSEVDLRVRGDAPQATRPVALRIVQQKSTRRSPPSYRNGFTRGVGTNPSSFCESHEVRDWATPTDRPIAAAGVADTSPTAILYIRAPGAAGPSGSPSTVEFAPFHPSREAAVVAVHPSVCTRSAAVRATPPSVGTANNSGPSPSLPDVLPLSTKVRGEPRVSGDPGGLGRAGVESDARDGGDRDSRHASENDPGGMNSAARRRGLRPRRLRADPALRRLARDSRGCSSPRGRNSLPSARQKLPQTAASPPRATIPPNRRPDEHLRAEGPRRPVYDWNFREWSQVPLPRANVPAL